MKLSGTRQAIHDALSWGQFNAANNGLVEYLTYLTKIEKSIINREPCADFLEAAYICAAINTLKPHLGGWLKFAYSESPSDLTHVILASKLRFDLFPMSTAKKHARYLALSSTSLEDYRLGYWMKRELPDVVYCDRIGVHKSNFDRDGWKEMRNRCFDVIKSWDRDGVGQISRMVRSLNGEADYPEQSPSNILKELANDN